MQAQVGNSDNGCSMFSTVSKVKCQRNLKRRCKLKTIAQTQNPFVRCSTTKMSKATGVVSDWCINSEKCAVVESLTGQQQNGVSSSRTATQVGHKSDGCKFCKHLWPWNGTEVCEVQFIEVCICFKCFEDYSESEQSCGSREAKMTQKKFHLYFFGKWHVYKMMNNEKFE